MILSSGYHVPVLLEEAMTALRVEPGKKYIDATLGGGGHTGEIIRRGGIVLGIDRDKDAVTSVSGNQGTPRGYTIGKELIIERGNFGSLKDIAITTGFAPVAGVLFDLGMSSHQIDSSGRGFSFKRDEPLDMRMDDRQSVTAADIVNKKNKEELYEIFSKYAEELNSRAICHAIVRARAVAPLTRTSDVSKIVAAIVPEEKERRKTLARIFQALRIVVNGELTELEQGVIGAVELLARGGRLVVISYHSLEDRSVKLALRRYQRQGVIKDISRHAIVATAQEQERNPRSRSAKLRVAEKL